LPNKEAPLWERLRSPRASSIVLIVEGAPNVAVNHVALKLRAQKRKEIRALSGKKEFVKSVAEKAFFLSLIGFKGQGRRDAPSLKPQVAPKDTPTDSSGGRCIKRDLFFGY
jgi:hypothetical protein